MRLFATTGPRTLAALLLLTGLSAIGSETAVAATAGTTATTTATPGVIDDYLEAHESWIKEIKNQPRGGMTTRVSTETTVNIGLQSGEHGSAVPVRTVCLFFQKGVYDVHGQLVVTDPSGREPFDHNCVEVQPNNATIATDLSTAAVDVPALQLNHVTWTCPDGPFGDCSAQESPGPVVNFRATFTATSPVDTFTTCLDQPRSQQTIAARDAVGTGSVDGVDTGADAGAGRIAHWTRIRGCPK